MNFEWINDLEVGDEVHFIAGMLSRYPINMKVTKITPKRLQAKECSAGRLRTFTKGTGMEYGSLANSHTESYIRPGHYHPPADDKKDD